MITLQPDASFLEQTGVSRDQIETLQEEVNQAHGDTFSGEIAIGLVSDAEIRRLNRMYRGKDAVTDVLSFSYVEDSRGRGSQLGDVVISLDQAKRQAEAGDVELELIDLLVHGVLHVLGHDHEEPQDAKRMFPLQDRIVKSIV